MVVGELTKLSSAGTFFQENMLWVFFFYGLGFIILALAIFFKNKETTNKDLIANFYMLALFGLIHGLTEWTDWLRLYVSKHSIAGGQIIFLDGIKTVLLAVSFLFLLQFGINMLVKQTKKYYWLKGIPLGLGLSFFWVAVYTNTFFAKAELAARFGFGFTGALLTCFAFILLAKKFNSLELRKLTFNSLLFALVFGLYALFGGLIINPFLGIPPQVFRMITALIAAYAAFGLLDVFVIEKKLISNTIQIMKKTTGPVAITLANKVNGLKVSSEGEIIELKGEPIKIFRNIIEVYSKITGPVAKTLAKKASEFILSEYPSINVPKE